MVPQILIVPQTKDTITTMEVDSCGAGLWTPNQTVEKRPLPGTLTGKNYAAQNIDRNKITRDPATISPLLGDMFFWGQQNADQINADESYGEM